MTEQVLTAGQEWKLHWPLVLAASVGFSFMSMMAPAAGVFMGPLTEAFGWNRTQLSVGLGIAGLIGMVGSPFLGLLLDRFGARRLALPGLVLTALATSAFSLTNGTMGQWIGLWVVWGAATLFTISTTWTAAVASVFKAGRGLALGVTLAGTAVAQIVVPPLANWLIATQGWRAAYVYLGFGWGGFALLFSLLFLYDARDTARLSRGPRSDAVTPHADLPGLTIAQALRSSALWRLAIATFLTLVVTVAVSVHQFPILTEAGISRASAAWLASLVGVAGIAGKLITGVLIDRLHARWVGSITLASTAFAYPLLLEPLRSPTLIVVAMVISGYAAGTKMQLCGFLAARYGGLRHYGAIFGFMTSMIALAGATGPIGAGVIFDHFGSYAPLLIGGTVISLISAGLVLSLGAYPEFDLSPAAAPRESAPLGA